MASWFFWQLLEGRLKVSQIRMDRVWTIKHVKSSLTVVAILAITFGVLDKAVAQAVKKSRSGICHCSGGQFYDRTSNFTAFETIDACLASGGREPKRGQGDCATASYGDPENRNAGITDKPAAAVVKKSGSGICHCPGGQFYERTSNFTAFDILKACLASGGREPKRGQGVCPNAPRGKPTTMHLPKPGKYDRSAFGGWGDDDGDYQNTRHERLISRSIEPVELSEDGCLVISGYWKDLYCRSWEDRHSPRNRRGFRRPCAQTRNAA